MGRVAKPNFRFRSVRAYRRYLERIMKEAYEGQRPMSDIAAAATAAKAGAELFMAEQMLMRSGMDKEALAHEHPHGEDGTEDVLEAGRVFRQKRVTVTRGTNKRGEPTDSVTVQAQGGPDDEDLQNDAETEALIYDVDPNSGRTTH
jgi:hypothetical protein